LPSSLSKCILPSPLDCYRRVRPKYRATQNLPNMKQGTDVVDLPAIPPALAQYKEDILSTTADTVRLEVAPAASLKPWQSKVGGEPYLPLGEEYPCNSEGKPLMLLAQINFEEMPHLAGFPEKGLLQFYVDGRNEDYLCGIDFDNLTSQKGSRVLYFDRVEEDESKLRQDTAQYQDRKESMGFPLNGASSYSIKFHREKQYISAGDYRFQIMSFEDKAVGKYDKAFPASGHRVAGYPNFTQEDPREKEELKDHKTLLLQIDSEYKESEGVDIMWGDSGVGAFFIRPEDLEKRDFTNVLFSWDCC